EPVVDRLRVAERATLGYLDRVDVADEIADGRIRGGQLLSIPLSTVLPVDRSQLTVGGNQRKTPRTYRGVRVVVDLAAGDDGSPLVEQPDERADQPCLALAALAQQHQVMSREQRAFDFRRDGLVEADDAGKGRLACREAGDQVGADLSLDASVNVAGRAQLAQSGDGGHSHSFDATCPPPDLPAVRCRGNCADSCRSYSVG